MQQNRRKKGERMRSEYDNILKQIFEYLGEEFKKEKEPEKKVQIVMSMIEIYKILFLYRQL